MHTAPKSHVFNTAGTLSCTPLVLPSSSQELLGGLIDVLENGCITLIEANQLKEVHREMHAIMVAAIAKDWQISIVDLANCFNPQLISTIAFDYGMHSSTVLQTIGLARPFQIHQAVSIIQQLVLHLLRFDEHKKQLLVVTDISSLFFDEQLANEDPAFPVPQLEMLRQSLGVLQSLAVQGHTVLISDRTERAKKPSGTGAINVHASSLDYSAKVHLDLDYQPGKRIVTLKNHPYHAINQVSTMYTKYTLLGGQQESLQTFFDY